MKFFETIRRVVRETFGSTPTPASDGFDTPTRGTASGIKVDESRALTYSAVWRATRIICEAFASLPCFTYETLANNDRKTAADYYLWPLLKTAPNPTMGSTAFREAFCQHMVLWGNGFAEIEWEGGKIGSKVVALWLIHPSRVRPSSRSDRYATGKEVPEGSYLVRNSDGSQTVLLREEMLHVPGALSDDGIWGRGVIRAARESIGFGLVTERHGAAYFGSGAQPKGIVTAKNLTDVESRRAFRADWKRVHANHDEIAILGGEATYTPITISNEDSQFLETRAFNIREIARWFGLPAFMLEEAANGTASYASVEQREIDFVVNSLMGWIKRFEEQCNLKLVRPEDRAKIYVELVLAGLLRGDFTTRTEAHVKRLTNGLNSINEIRRLDNLPSIGPAGDQFYVPLNMTTAERMRQGLEKQDASKPAPTDKNEPADEETNADEETRAATRKAITETLSRLYGIEAKEAVRAADSDTFAEWLTAFAPKHEQRLYAALEPLAGLLKLMGVSDSPASIAGRLAATSRIRLSTLEGTATRVLFAAAMKTWDADRANEAADILLGAA